jgi:hypothetical protein
MHGNSAGRADDLAMNRVAWARTAVKTALAAAVISLYDTEPDRDKEGRQRR